LVDDDHEFRAAACMELEDLGFGVTGIPTARRCSSSRFGKPVDVIVFGLEDARPPRCGFPDVLRNGESRFPSFSSPAFGDRA